MSTMTRIPSARWKISSISGLRLPREFIKSQGKIKAAAAQANRAVGALPEELGKFIVQAAEEVIDGKRDVQFVVDVFRAGAGTSQNMNANEVIVCRDKRKHDATITAADMDSQQEINVMIPVIAYNLLHSISIIANAIEVFHTRCVDGLIANEDRCRYYVEHSLALAASLNPAIGYERAAAISKTAFALGRKRSRMWPYGTLLPP
ncbi:lyase family protein [Brevibacillus sp. B_LB10_24]|uniref:lyase family protein n=1 Tax=Brevibacillus sp. B_LB10_24 TaxID=3380645 RepID=UPI0038BC86F1